MLENPLNLNSYKNMITILKIQGNLIFMFTFFNIQIKITKRFIILSIKRTSAQRQCINIIKRFTCVYFINYIFQLIRRKRTIIINAINSTKIQLYFRKIFIFFNSEFLVYFVKLIWIECVFCIQMWTDQI
ncbi:hypothetical protein IMG5_021830 [Ichthyophthirius multifiliis]|uniref:Transmembrane protein n=1 Tax=Ichthyophthirius multifiliis TaxID=5932 RepID=G0QKT9_ICHMU|nr:hypothetical protein IMG5_021830 [Ichthyophthirius multifiliis]EGR34163.1 hypothetical protein IMG5_021830 [Ichthyophthirius multifiliis]|eukprot:XP_004039467.1 hypothetical protein IMG5_021830 [Ichthyophthirius multifiliis]